MSVPLSVVHVLLTLMWVTLALSTLLHVAKSAEHLSRLFSNMTEQLLAHASITNIWLASAASLQPQA